MARRNGLKEKIDRQVKRKQKAEREQPTLIGQTIYIGTLGILLVLPIVGGAYLGQWLDSMMDGYSIRWTTSLILLGVMVGAVNVYLFIKE